MLTVKKERERFYLDAFLSHYGRSDWRVRDECPEPPDFIVDTPDGPVGIEVTTLNKDEGDRGSPARARESAHARFLGDLADEYYARGGAPLKVNALLDGLPAPSALPSLAALLRTRRPTHAGEDVRVGVSEPLIDGRAIFYLRSLPADWCGYRRWQCVSDAIGWVRPLSAGEITRRIERKAERLATCQVVERVLLLLVADRRRDSGRFELPAGSIVVDKHGFSEVHLLVYPHATHRLDART